MRNLAGCGLKMKMDAGCGDGVTLDSNTSAEAGFAQFDRGDAG